MSILYILFMCIILMHDLYHNQLVDISIGKADHHSTDHDQVSHDDVQSSYMSDDNESVKEWLYRNVKELLRVVKIRMCDVVSSFT